MSRWGPWDWIAYICLGIASSGLALAAFPKEVRVFGDWSTFFSSPVWSFVPLVFFVIATIIFIFRLWSGAPPAVQTVPIVDKSELTLHIYGDDRWPTRVSETNIWRYFYLRNLFTVVNNQTGQKFQHCAPILCLCFDKPTKVGTLEVQSPDIQLPKHEVKEFRERFAIIGFEQEPPAGTLQIKTY